MSAAKLSGVVVSTHVCLLRRARSCSTGIGVRVTPPSHGLDGIGYSTCPRQSRPRQGYWCTALSTPPAHSSPRASFFRTAAAGAPKAHGGRSALSALPVSISSDMDAGNIEVVKVNGDDIRLTIRKDPYTERTDNAAHSQWFHFRATGVGGRDCTFSITNCKDTSYPQAWDGYQTCASYDGDDWFRVRTEYDAAEGVLSWKVTPREDSMQFAYFAPYSYQRHQELIQRCSQHAAAELQVLGSSLEGRPIEMLTLGTGPVKVWVIARQHPGESMAEWFAEGLLDRLLTDSRALARATFRVVPNMNPDGAIKGHLRTNAGGANLNREWAPTGDYMAPTLERSPEVAAVLSKMDEVGVDLFLDIHGDEETPANFFAGFEGIPGVSEEQLAQFFLFREAMTSSSPDFQTELGYSLDEPGEANLAVCNNQIAHRFGCVAVTFEQPFKDCWNNPDPVRGWSPERAMRLGSDTVTAVLEFIPSLARVEA